jgi:hypothetical protein
LVADREFIGHQWFKFLNSHGVPFTIRLRQDTLADASGKVTALFKSVNRGHLKVLTQTYSIFGLDLYLCALRLDAQELLILVSNRPAKQALVFYKRRWQIESLFKALKSSGFKLEDTHLTNPDRLSTLVAVVSLAFLWALKIGHWLHCHRPLRVKSHGRREKSTFRLGLDFVRRAISNLTLDKQLLDDAFRVLSFT